jgi:hypothetical protein
LAERPRGAALAADSRGCSSVGRALQSHCRGQGFDSPQLHAGRDRAAGAGPACPSGHAVFGRCACAGDRHGTRREGVGGVRRHRSSEVEHSIRNRAVVSSILTGGSVRGSSSVGRASASQAEGRGFEPRLPLCGEPQVLDHAHRRRGAGFAAVMAILPLGVTGNTSDSGSEESWFEPRRGNSSGRRVVGARRSGEVAKWLRQRFAKPSSPKGSRGFESHPLRWHLAGHRPRHGQVSERLKEHDWKSCGVNSPRGFESLPVRRQYRSHASGRMFGE